jgi:hypothetical protein
MMSRVKYLYGLNPQGDLLSLVNPGLLVTPQPSDQAFSAPLEHHSNVQKEKGLVLEPRQILKS